MDLDDVKCGLTIGGIIVMIILSFLLPIIISINISRERNINFEKYKIEMQYKHGDVVENKE